MMLDWLEIHILRSAIVLASGLILFFIFRKILPRFVHRTITLRMLGKPETEVHKRSQTLARVVSNTIGILIAVVTVFTIFAEVGINIAPALASLGIIGVAIGFGAQSLIKDLINGLFILMENQYSIGDVVKVSGITGLVEEVNLRRTILRDMDGTVHYVPNGEINIASNLTKEYSRVNMNITLAYHEDLDRAINLINNICSNLVKEQEWQEKIIKTPQVLRVDGLTESGVEVKIFGDTQPLAQWPVMGEIRKRIKDAFDKAGIEFGWQHMKVYFGNSMPAKR